MTKQEIINYMYENHVQGDFKIEEMAEDLAQPEIIRCKDCKHYEWMSNRVPEEQAYHCHCWDAGTGKDDYCSFAELRGDLDEKD